MAPRREAAGGPPEGITMAMKRGGHGEGSMKQRADGLSEARVRLEAGGFYGKTRRGAQVKLCAPLRGIDPRLD